MSIDFLQDLTDRGLLHQVSAPAISDLLKRERVTAYIGFDPTADSLHVGSLLQLVLLMRFERAGHRPIAVVGGGTGLIGDPSGKQAERTLLDQQQLERNVSGLRRQIERFLDFNRPDGALLVNNADWLCKLSLVDFLRDIGKHFSVNALIVRDSVRTRLEGREQGISYTEFSYVLLQAFDFLELFDRHDCRLQMGGSDQWGNIVSGADLIRRLRNVEAFGVTVPLVTKADGTKFGKTEEGNVWLDPQRTSPYEFYQFWLNTPDADAIPHLLRFSFRPAAQIKGEIAAAATANPAGREPQRLLAEELTELVHGREALESAQRTTAALFSRDADFRRLSAQELADAFRGAPRSRLPADQLGTPDAGLLNQLVAAGLYESRGLAKKDMPLGGVSVNNVAVTDIQYTLTAADVLAERFIVLRKGKKTYHVIEVTREP